MKEIQVYRADKYPSQQHAIADGGVETITIDENNIDKTLRSIYNDVRGNFLELKQVKTDPEKMFVYNADHYESQEEARENGAGMEFETKDLGEVNSLIEVMKEVFQINPIVEHSL